LELAATFRAGHGPRRLAAWLLCLPLLLPLAFLAASWSQPEAALWSHLLQHTLPRVLGNSLLLGAGIAALTALLGTGLAWLSACCDYPGRRWLDWGLVLPLAMPAYVVAFVYVGLSDYAGPAQTAWRELSGASAALPGLRNLPGAILLLSLVLYPYVYLLARAAFLRQGSSAFEAARSLGLTPWQAFRRVALPLARPAWMAGAALAMLEALADFGAVSVLGVDTFTTAIYRTWFGMYSLPAAAQLATVLLGLVALVLLAERLLRGRARYHSQRLRAAPRIPLRGWRAGLALGTGLLVLLLGFGLPVLQLLLWLPRAGVGIEVLFELTQRTLVIGALVALTVLALALALALLKRRAGGDRAVTLPVFVANLGYAVPGTVLAVAVMWMLVGIERPLATHFGLQLGLSLGLLGLLMALTARFVRVGFEPLESGLSQLRPSLLEAARALGATPLQRVFGVVLPLLRPSALAAVLLVLVETMKEMPATLMLRPFGWDTLAVRIHAYTSEGLWQSAAAPSLVLVGVGLLPVWWLVRQQE
jgi:iron(III) transport system permease protein